MNNEKLKLCPFCGKPPIVSSETISEAQGYSGYTEYRIYCTCWRATTGIYRSYTEAIVAWNTRAGEDA